MTLPDGVTTVFLDAGFTTIWPSPPVGQAYAMVAAWHGVEPDPAELERAFFAAFRAARKASRGATPQIMDPGTGQSLVADGGGRQLRRRGGVRRL